MDNYHREDMETAALQTARMCVEQAKQIAALEAECREYREALEAAAYNLERIETADWCIEQARLAAGAGGRIARKALSAGRK